MSFARPCVLVAAAFVMALPAVCQNTTTAQPETAASQMAPTGSYSALRDSLAVQSQALSGDVMTQRAILKRNQELLKEAHRLEAANKKMEAEKQHMIQQNAELERQRAALAQTHVDAPSQTSAQPQMTPQTPASSQGVDLAKATTGESK